MTGRLAFALPPELEASAPAEARGMTRDAVRMLVARRSTGDLVHSTFALLPRFLDAGDLVVVNTSGTIPAAVDGHAPDGSHIVVHLSTHLDGNRWVVEPLIYRILSRNNGAQLNFLNLSNRYLK